MVTVGEVPSQIAEIEAVPGKLLSPGSVLAKPLIVAASVLLSVPVPKADQRMSLSIGSRLGPVPPVQRPRSASVSTVIGLAVVPLPVKVLPLI